MVGEEDGRDVVQETLVTAWRELPRLRESHRFEPWLRSICMNRCRNLLRTRSRRPTLLPGIEPSQVADRLTEEPMERLHAGWAVDELLDLLTPDERSVFVLHYVADLTLRDVATTLDQREGTVKTRLHAGLRRLRAAMSAEGVA